ncbi:MAG: sigma-70 family RNA polymerase sigma factor [Cytophagaceae bacterium]|nr:sigma-70 family RNA polymerase sigma factor [Gemmatimonadaceae bacterium]
MNESLLPPALPQARNEFDELVRDVRVELHRYCARMTGSVIDGEDVLQDALARAFYMLPHLAGTTHLRPWLFRIAHNKCIDFLRRYDRRFGEPLDEHPMLADETNALESRELAELALPHYLRLTALQRSCVILKDVVGYSLVELSELLDVSIPAIKGALHRGRLALREGRDRLPEPASPLDMEQARLLATYVEHFNGRNFDALRDMLAEDARLELVGRHSARGKGAVGSYYSNYERLSGWRVDFGRVDGRPALLGFDGSPTEGDGSGVERPTFFILITWRDGRVRDIRDYRYARHTTELARFEHGSVARRDADAR